MVVVKPMTELCLTCQENTSHLQRASNLSDREKSERLRTHQQHLNRPQTEQEFYKHSCAQSEKAIEMIGVTLLNSENHSTCSFKCKNSLFIRLRKTGPHVLQPNATWADFTLRKCGIFGVMCEGVPREVNFLIDEAVTTGKGANATISYIHYYFEHHGLQETDIYLNADNCAGQNKNNNFLWYLAWRTFMKLHHSITYSFLIAGHTKFAPDHYFGLIKKAYKLTYGSSLYEFARLVDTSSTSGLNKAQLVGTRGENSCPCLRLGFVSWTILQKVAKYKELPPFSFFKGNPWKSVFQGVCNKP